MSIGEIAEISFIAGGTEYRLAPPTPRIAFKVSRLVGGLGTALSRCQAGDLDVYRAVLKAACPAAPATEDALEAFVFEHLPVLALPIARYVWSLQNGGRMPPKAGGAGDAEEAAPGKNDEAAAGPGAA